MKVDDERLIKAVQDGIPLCLRPFEEIGKALGLEEEEVIEKLKALMEKGLIRRFAASLAHHKLGITSNVMGVWRVPEERVDEVGRLMASFEEVTHCYQRPTAPDWPYNLYTMVHGYSDEECEEALKRISQKTGITDYLMLYSQKEFKKTWSRL